MEDGLLILNPLSSRIQSYCNKLAVIDLLLGNIVDVNYLPILHLIFS